MIHAFLLTVYLGTQIVSNDMYFRNIDDCKYFASRLNQQPAVPNRTAGEDVPKRRSYTAVCEPSLIDPKRVKLYD
jgi:hypothetical protein